VSTRPSLFLSALRAIHVVFAFLCLTAAAVVSVIFETHGLKVLVLLPVCVRAGPESQSRSYNCVVNIIFVVFGCRVLRRVRRFCLVSFMCSVELCASRVPPIA